MKAFVATSPNTYLQDIALQGGEYTFQAKVLSASQKYAFALLIDGVWVKFDAPTQTSNWRQIKHRLSFEGLATKFDLVSDYATAGAPIKVIDIQIEQGSFYSTPRAHEEDTMEVIQNAKIEAESAAKSYADAQDNLKEISIKAWADGEITAAEQSAIDAAQGKVDAQAALEIAARQQLQTLLEAYADGKVSAEEQARIDQAAANMTIANNYALAAAEAQRVLAEAYADGIVDDEEQARINDANAKLQEAKDHAQGLATGLQGQIDTIGTEITAMETSVTKLESKTDFLSEVKVAGNTLAAGALVVGNGTKANAGITGEGTSGESTRMYAGSDYVGRNKANWRMRDDGVEERWTTVDGQRVIVSLVGVIDGIYKEIKFNNDGTYAKVLEKHEGYISETWFRNGAQSYQLGRNGIFYISETPHSWAGMNTKLMTTSASPIDTALINELKTKLQFTEHRDTPFGDYASITIASPIKWYQFNAGRNATSVNYEQYQVFMYANNNGGSLPSPTTPTKLADGWYVADFSSQTEDIPSGSGNANYSFTANFFKVVAGKSTDSRALTISGTYFIHP